jgi:hypothetical protein
VTEPIEPIQPPNTASGRPLSGAASNLSSPTPKTDDWREAALAAGAPLAAYEPGASAEENESARSATNEEEGPTHEVEYLFVKSGLDNENTALYERHPDHRRGEAFVGPNEVVEVAKTPMVLGKLNTGELVESDQGEYDEYVTARKEEASLTPEERAAAREERALEQERARTGG